MKNDRRGIHDSGKYRQPTEAEAAEMRRLYEIIAKSLAKDDNPVYGRATAALQNILNGMRKKPDDKGS